MANSHLLHSEVTEPTIKAFYYVYNTLGSGFLEKVYENALAHVLRCRGFGVAQQVPIKVYFEGALVGEYFADLLVNDRVIVEIKACQSIHEAHEAQLLNYLKASPVEVGLLFNFGESPEFRRKLLTNDRKSALSRPAFSLPDPSLSV